MTELDASGMAEVSLVGGVEAIQASFTASDECLDLAGRAGGLGHDPEVLLAAFAAERADTRALALTLTALTQGADDTEAVLGHVLALLGGEPRRIAALGAISPVNVAYAAIALDSPAWGHPEITSALLRCLDDPDPIVRGRSALALGVVGSGPGPVLQPVLRMLHDDPSGMAVVGAVLGLSFMITESTGPVIIPRLRESARADPDWQVRGASSWGLGWAELDAPIGLRDIDDRVKAMTLSSHLGGIPRSYRPEVLRIARDKTAEAFLRVTAAAALIDCGDPELSEAGFEWMARYRADDSFAEHHGRLDVVLDAHSRSQDGELG